ncbi:hypothetical protein NYP18_09395 [Corynebacterium sp. YIM 101645]|uniref:Uncharacterized protein n=1 Tax=Corynebacterium lemuris TaxID=1859292 RepID=A0ABT2FXX4_9CORY|nr:hypothetical protein [Corynebacterium lemuris]MCS5479874.1 hypothetical protein [Corynebacterium lemuris]
MSALLTDFLPTAEEGTFDLGCACYFPAPVSTAETTLLRVDHDWAGKRPGRMSPAGRVH